MAAIFVEVPDDMQDWLGSRIGPGGFPDEAAYVRDLIRQDQARRLDDGALAAALVEGERSGPGRRLVPDILAQLRTERNGVAA